jgi:hypothetical protein
MAFVQMCGRERWLRLALVLLAVLALASLFLREEHTRQRVPAPQSVQVSLHSAPEGLLREEEKHLHCPCLEEKRRVSSCARYRRDLFACASKMATLPPDQVIEYFVYKLTYRSRFYVYACGQPQTRVALQIICCRSQLTLSFA